MRQGQAADGGLAPVQPSRSTKMGAWDAAFALAEAAHLGVLLK
jgi:hypothetical protein